MNFRWSIPDTRLLSNINMFGGLLMHILYIKDDGEVSPWGSIKDYRGDNMKVTKGDDYESR